jgi:hypothetical protein
MKKYFITVEWNHGFIHTYDVMGGEPGSRSDAVQDAKTHLNSARNIKSYIIKDEEGNIVYDKSRDNSKTKLD